MIEAFSKTPRYVLRNESLPVSPIMVENTSAMRSHAIFGFSDKAEYDQFVAGSELKLRPYPLVMRYLQSENQIRTNSLNLVVLDATSDQQEILNAATYEAVVRATERNEETVLIEYILGLDQSSRKYFIQNENSDPKTHVVH